MENYNEYEYDFEFDEEIDEQLDENCEVEFTKNKSRGITREINARHKYNPISSLVDSRSDIGHKRKVYEGGTILRTTRASSERTQTRGHETNLRIRTLIRSECRNYDFCDDNDYLGISCHGSYRRHGYCLQ